ncbi:MULTISPECIES: carbohydrate ABC transporter permease [unclassified Paenibacillus]|uniref:carbohydrate ABC transporter permease n=1 Tax=unclassified Paenibacillus TaxID=185978 RepID=UPI001C1027E0|nr:MULTISPECIES: carbohydrate ABC transporter permease [unclassified Paenibacillus]MBU5441394.1 carbohydrate ABC transporter permease [Paenibacillus sp. MSJ-34]CAH0118260.1 Diacetylchitobiose uptake system permease protein NgcG [Paenibacillus sp. CECT 9249]
MNWKNSVAKLPAYLVILFFFCVTMLPILWILIGSLKSNAELMSSPFSLPEEWHFANYRKAYVVGQLGQLFLNSVFVSLLSVGFCLLFATMAAYAVSQGKKWTVSVYVAMTAGIFLPVNSLMVPYYLIAGQFDLLNSKWALITTYTAMGFPLTLLLVYGFVRSVPKEIMESAYMDGAGFYYTYGRILIPLIRPGMATAAIFQFLLCWNEFLYALLLTSDQKVRTLQVGISLFKSQFNADFAAMFAAIVVSVIPIVIIFILLQKQVIQGLTSGALKG